MGYAVTITEKLKEVGCSEVNVIVDILSNPAFVHVSYLANCVTDDIIIKLFKDILGDEWNINKINNGVFYLTLMTLTEIFNRESKIC